MTGSMHQGASRKYCGANAIEIKILAVAENAFSFERTHYSGETGRVSPFDDGQKLARINLAKADDFGSKRKVAAHNFRQVAGIAMRYANRGVDYPDLLREGMRGLVHALEKFEQEGGIRFQVYARCCIRERIERAIMERNNLHCTVSPAC